MTVAAKPARDSAPRPRRRFRHRNPPTCWPGTTAIAASCRGARRRASAPIRTASGCPKSCCSRPRSRRSGPITHAFWRAGPISGRWRRRRSTTCSRPGPGSAITPAPAICTLAPASWSSGTAANSRASEEGLRALPGIGAYTAAAIAAIAFDAAGDAGRRQYRARHRAALCGRHAAAGGQAGDFPAGARTDAATARRRFRPSHDGSRRHHLHAEDAGLRAVSLERKLRGSCARRCRDISAARAEAGRRVAPRRRFCCAPRRRFCAAAHAAGKRPARRHDRSADDGMDERFRRKRAR